MVVIATVGLRRCLGTKVGESIIEGRTPMDTFAAGLELARQKNLDKELYGVSDACQL